VNHIGNANKKVSDTPISDSTPHNVGELGMLCRKLERELNAANERIKRLEEELERTKQDRNAIAKNTREPLLLKLDHAAERINRLEELLWLSQPVCEAKEAKP